MPDDPTTDDPPARRELPTVASRLTVTDAPTCPAGGPCPRYTKTAPRKRLAYMPFYTGDWLASRTVAAMTLAERGAYLNLLCYAWNADPPCRLAGTDSEWRAWAGCGPKMWARSRGRLLSAFAIADVDRGCLAGTHQYSWQRYCQICHKGHAAELNVRKRWTSATSTDSRGGIPQEELQHLPRIAHKTTSKRRSKQLTTSNPNNLSHTESIPSQYGTDTDCIDPHSHSQSTDVPVPFDLNRNTDVREESTSAPAALASVVPSPNGDHGDKCNEALPFEGVRTRRKKIAAAPADTNGFETFWATYPRKVGRALCVTLWQRLQPDAALQARIVASVQAHATWPDWTRDGGQYIPHPATFLRQGRWEDEAPAAIAMSVSPATQQTLANRERLLARLTAEGKL